MTVCVTGGAGFIGKILVQRLQQRQVQLRLLTRKTAGPKEDCFVADLTDEMPDLTGLFDDVDVVFHCAGEVEHLSRMRALHVRGTELLLNAVEARIAATGKALHWVQLSSVGVYGPPRQHADETREITELSPEHPVGEYEITKACADRLVIDYASRQPLFSYTVLRPSIVIGKQMTNQSVRSLVKVIQKRLFFYIGSRSSVATYIHVDDVVDALLRCAEDECARGQVFNLSNDCMLSEIVEAVAGHSGISSRTLCVPALPLRLLVKLAGQHSRLPLTGERIDALVRHTRYSNQKIKQMLTFAPRHAIPDTIATLLDE